MTLLHQNPDFLVVDKPSGLLAVPGRGPDKQDCLLSRLHASFPEALTVHRLDQATSGLMVFARHGAAQRQLSRLFATRQVFKTYEALVSANGLVDADEWQDIDAPVMADWPNRPKQQVHPGGKPALSRWRVLGAQGARWRLALQPLTGRTHQLRVHLAHAGMPIVGDGLYGGAPASRLMLHACELGFEWAGQGHTWRSAVPF